MFTWTCPQCGREVPPSENACPNCGAQPDAKAAVVEPPATDPPAAPPGTRVVAHLRMLMVLWMAQGVIRVLSLVPGLLLWLPVSMPAAFSLWPGMGMWRQFPSPLTGAGWLFLLVNLAWSVACMMVARSFLERARWARIYTIVVSAIWLLDFPVGTLLSIYTLWVLLPESSESEYRQLAMQ